MSTVSGVPITAPASGGPGEPGDFDFAACAVEVDVVDDLSSGSMANLADARASLELITALYASARGAGDVTLPIEADHPLYAWILRSGGSIEALRELRENRIARRVLTRR